MSFEIEAKYRNPKDDQEIRLKLANLGAKRKAGYQVIDTYLRHPSRDFAKTGEAFRIRREGATNRMTYKGPKLNSEGIRSRPEIEIEMNPDRDTFEQALAMFTAMGFEPVASLEKYREKHLLDFKGFALSVEFDDAGELGRFVEIEVLIESQELVADAEKTIHELAGLLQLTEYEPRSYLRMWLEKHAGFKG